MPDSLKRRLLTGGIWVIAGKIVTAGSTLLLSKILALLLSKQGYGDYELALKIVTGSVLFAQLGLHQAAVRLIAEAMGRGHPERARAAIGRVYLLVAVGAAVVAGLLWAGGADLLSTDSLPGAAPYIAVWLVLVTFQVVNSEIFRGFKDLGLATLFGGTISVTVLIVVLGSVFLIRGQTNLHEVFRFTLIGLAISLAGSCWVLFRRLRRLPAGGAIPTRELIGISAPMWISGVTSFILMQSDLFLVNAFADEAARGDYAAAGRLVSVVATSLGLVNLVVPPFIADLYARGETVKLERLLRNAATLAGIPAFALLLIFVFFGADSLALITTDEFRTGADILAILSIGKLINVLTGSCGAVMLMTGHQREQMGITIVSAILTLGAAGWAGSHYGTLGVAWAYSAGNVLQNIWMLFSTRVRTGMWTHVGWPTQAEVRALFRR